jgi:MFS family permease
MEEKKVILSNQERWNIFFLVMAWACNVADISLVVGASAAIITSVGGSPSLTPFGTGAFFLGMALASLTCTHWIFELWGRKIGFWVGNVFGIIGSILGCVAIMIQSPTMVILSSVPLGAGAGIGLYLRFAAVEVVPKNFSAKAVSWVLTGGCLAAFGGPEAGEAAAHLFAGDDLDYLGIFMVAGLFYLAQGILLMFVTFPVPEIEASAGRYDFHASFTSMDSTSSSYYIKREVWGLLRRKRFVIPMLITALSWSIIRMPSSVLGVAMKESGYSDRHILTVIECHFVGMYIPGIWSGRVIKRFGSRTTCFVSMILSILAIAITLNCGENTSRLNANMWSFGMAGLGVAWNFSYSASTVWCTSAYNDFPHLKSKMQAANEFGSFLLSGSLLFSAGYLFELGGSGLAGWRIIQYVISGLVVIFFILVVVSYKVVPNTGEPIPQNKDDSSDAGFDIETILRNLPDGSVEESSTSRETKESGQSAVSEKDNENIWNRTITARSKKREIEEKYRVRSSNDVEAGKSTGIVHVSGLRASGLVQDSHCRSQETTETGQIHISEKYRVRSSSDVEAGTPTGTVRISELRANGPAQDSHGRLRGTTESGQSLVSEKFRVRSSNDVEAGKSTGTVHVSGLRANGLVQDSHGRSQETTETGQIHVSEKYRVRSSSDVEAGTPTGTVRISELRANGPAQAHGRPRRSGQSHVSNKRGEDQSPGALKPATEDFDRNVVFEADADNAPFRARADAWLVNNLEAQVARLTGEVGRLSSELDSYEGLNRKLSATVAELNDQNMI